MTVRTVVERAAPPFVWLDVVQPTPAELLEIAERYRLHPTSVQDCLDPEHLPKYERIGATLFLIVRGADPGAGPEVTTVQELTRKIAVFSGPEFLITIHRIELPFLTALREEYQGSGWPNGVNDPFFPQPLIDLINAAIDTYGPPLERAEAAISEFESSVFGEQRLADVLHRIYLQRQRVTLIKRLLRHTLDVIQKLTPAAAPTAPLYQDLRENAESMHFYADEMLDDVNNLLTIQLALASHRTNEVVRVLTVFSVFFLPLTFIVGVYGMNFEFMPELRARWGYPAVWGAMILLTGLIYLWFRRRGWLRG